jgi:hypothetical protein
MGAADGCEEGCWRGWWCTVVLALRQGPAHAHRVQLDAAQLGRGALSGRVHPQSRDQNRRDIGQSQPTRTASKMETPAAHDDDDDVLAAELPLLAQGPPPPPRHDHPRLR